MKTYIKHISALLLVFGLSISAFAGNENSIRIFPNPASDAVNIEIGDQSKLGDEVIITIYDLLGNTIYVEQCTAGFVRIPLPTDMPAGMYIVTFEDINRTKRLTSKMQKK